MRHLKLRRKFSRTPAHRQALLRNLATSLLRDEQCVTTVEKAKALRPVVERLITLGRVDTLHARRQAYGYLTSKAVVHKLFADIAPRYAARPGGYTRIFRTTSRHGDAAPLAVIQLVKDEETAQPTAGKKAKAEAPAAE